MSGKVISIEELVDEIPFSNCFENELIKKCHSMGLGNVKSFISIMDEVFYFPVDKNFSGLKFVGVFEYWLSDEYLKRCGLA